MSWKLLISDGLEESGIKALQNQGFIVDVKQFNPEELKINLPLYDGIIVRSATKVRADLMDLCPNLKFIARGGVGLDNIDVSHAQNRGILVINTPASSSRSVAELAMAHILCISRSLQISNRSMIDKESFIDLKKRLSNSYELQGRTLLLIGMGRIGRELAKMAIGNGMHVIATDPFIERAEIAFNIAEQAFKINIKLVSLEIGLKQADYISIHSPYNGNKILDESQFLQMKKGVCIINTSRGENINEIALLQAIDSGIVRAVGLDVFENEPNINAEILKNPFISMSPHIGASTLDAQQRIAQELVDKIVTLKAEFIPL
ncbi:MAG: NAD(P)-dependent oxidoreductase [Saprospiraceae bacterium]